MKTVKQDYSVFKVRLSNKPGEKQYHVVNQVTNEVQSAWDSLLDARKTARDLNMGLNHRLF